MKYEITKTDQYLLIVVDMIIIAHLPLGDSEIMEKVPLLPPLEYEDDVEKLATDEYEQAIKRRGQEYAGGYFEGLIDGYNKAKYKYKYTEEDIAKAVMFGRWGGTMKIDYENFIQSLSQPKMPVAFEYIDTITTDEGTYPEWVGNYIY